MLSPRTYLWKAFGEGNWNREQRLTKLFKIWKWLNGFVQTEIYEVTRVKISVLVEEAFQLIVCHYRIFVKTEGLNVEPIFPFS